MLIDAPKSPGELRWLVTTHSCDLIHHSEQETCAELLGLESLANVPDGEYALQSARMKIVTAFDRGANAPLFFRARAAYRLTVPRYRLKDLTPDSSICLRSASDAAGLRGKSERELAEWLAARYSRGWTPSEFDRRLKTNVGKIQKSLARLRSQGVEEILVRVTPSEELAPDEAYEITVLLLLAPQFASNMNAVRAEANIFVDCLQRPGLIVMASPPNVDLSTHIGYAYVRGWLRFHEILRDSLAATPV